MFDCYYRFDHSFQGHSQFQNNHRPPFPSAANIATVSHSTPVQAMTATAETITDSIWYPNSGASNHVTLEVSNLMQMKDYFGPEQVYVGNGKGLSIKHIGQSNFCSTYTSTILSLKHLLHVPEITKNLLSVQICK